MKAYIILTQKQHTDTVCFEDKKGRRTDLVKDRISIKKANIFEFLSKGLEKRYMRVFFTKKDAALNILEPTITDSILKSFESAKSKKIVKQHQLKAFFLIKTMNVLLNTRKRVYSCNISEEDLVIENGVKMTRNAYKVTQEKISMLQMRNSLLKGAPGVQKLLNGILSIQKEILDNLPKESREIAAQLKYGLKEIPMKNIGFVDILIEATKISEEILENEQQSIAN